MPVNIHEAKTNLSRLIQQAEAGEEVIIARNGKPVVKLVSVAPIMARPPRVLGRLKDKLQLPDNWEEEFDAIGRELEDIMINGPLFPDEVPQPK